MIIGVEVKDNNLLISYYNQVGKISYISKRLHDHEIFNWVESDKPSVLKNWNGKNIKKAKSDEKWLTRTRLEELIIEKLTPAEIETIYNNDFFPNKAFLDIEIELISDEFPDPAQAKMPVSMISFCNEEGVSYVLSKLTSENHPTGLKQSEIDKMEVDVNEYFSKVVTHKENDKKIFDVDFKIKFKHFDSEKELLEFYFHKILPKQPFITGWNVIDFDWQYLMNRAKRLKIDPMMNMPSNKTFSKRHKLPVHVGILDYMQLFMDPGYKPYKVVENYTLDYVSKLCLNTTKLKHPYKNMLEFQKDVPMFTMYNVIDNLLVKLIDDKHGMLDVAFSLANVAQIEVNKIQAPVHITEVLMCREFLNKNLRMLKKPWSSGINQKEETYEGAYVMPPTPGYYDFVACYDFKSMYPNIQMQFNISPDAYLGKRGSARETGREITTKNNTLFSNKEDSVTRTILNRLYSARVRAQDNIKNLLYDNK